MVRMEIALIRFMMGVLFSAARLGLPVSGFAAAGSEAVPEMEKLRFHAERRGIVVAEVMKLCDLVRVDDGSK